MSEDKPLHVQVAEALGWHGWIRIPTVGELHAWIGRQPHEPPLAGSGIKPPRYDTDWSATGPLIERFQITLGFDGESLSGTWIATDQPLGEMADGEIDPNYFAARMHSLPLIAVCHLILALHAAGKLTPKI